MKVPIVLHVAWFVVALAGTEAWSVGVDDDLIDACPVALLAWLMSAGLGYLQDHQRTEPTIIPVRRQTTRRPRMHL